MNKTAKDIVTECSHASDEERISFPEVVARLMQVGVERYHADLLRGEKTYYLPSGESEVVPGAAINATAAETFSAPGIEAALRAIQSGKIAYRRFCEQIKEAGCVGYLVSIAGRRAVYYGRTGECHVELFPPKAG